MGTPCLMTLSRSTLTNCCGTLARKVVLKPAISGRFLAAVRNVCRLDARNCTSPPARSSSANVNPPEVPTPGKLPVDSLLHLLELFCPRLALVPGLQCDEKECVVAGADKTKQAKADD